MGMASRGTAGQTLMKGGYLAKSDNAGRCRHLLNKLPYPCLIGTRHVITESLL